MDNGASIRRRGERRAVNQDEHVSGKPIFGRLLLAEAILQFLAHEIPAVGVGRQASAEVRELLGV